MRSIGEPTSEAAKVLAGVLSSRVDADKAAYLIQDSAMTGARYGLGIDMEGLLSSLTCPSADDLARHGKPALGIRERGLSAAESMILARYWMIRRVYWHHTNRALMAAFKYVIALLAARDGFQFADYLRENLAAGERQAMSWLYDAVERFRVSPAASDAERNMRNPLEAMVRGDRLPYRRFVILEHGDPSTESLDHQIYKAIEKKTPSELLDLGHELGRMIGDLAPGLVVRSGDVLVDLPMRKRELSGGLTFVYGDTGDEQLGELMHVSPLLKGWQAEFDMHAKRCRVFIHPEVDEALGARAEEARREVKKWLAYRLRVA